MSDKDHRNTATYILASAHKVVTTERGNQHGGAEDSFQMIADLWATYLNNTNRNVNQPADLVRVTAYDVAQMMSLLKIARAVHGDPLNDDNYVDASGYQSLAAAIAGVKAPAKEPVSQPAAPQFAPPPMSPAIASAQRAIPVAKHVINTPPDGDKAEDDALSAVASALKQEIK